jgi:2'-5' RNA ligase
LVDQFDDLQTMLGQFPFVQLYPDDMLHITVQEIGYIREDAGERDEMTRARLAEFTSMADRALRDFPRFQLHLGAVNSFADVAFLDIHDDGWLSRIQGRLMELMAVSPSTRYPYLPHLAVAAYTRSEPMGNYPAMLAEWRDTQMGSMIVDTVDVVLIDPTEPQGPSMEVVHQVLLGTTRATGTIPIRPDVSRT